MNHPIPDWLIDASNYRVWLAASALRLALNGFGDAQALRGELWDALNARRNIRSQYMADRSAQIKKILALDGAFSS